MAAFDFPNNPNTNDTYSANGISYVYNGNVWKRVGSGDIATITNAIINSDLDGKGELLVGDGVGDPTALPVGQDGYILKANSSTATGLEWVLASSANAPISGTEQVNWDVDHNWYDIDGVDTLNVRLIKFIGASQAGSPTGTGPRLTNTNSQELKLAFPYNGGANYQTTILFAGPAGETHFFSPLRISDTVDVKSIANTYVGSGGYLGFYVQVDTKTPYNRYGNTGSSSSFQFKDYKSRGLNIPNVPTKLGEWKDAPAFHAVPGITYRFDQTDTSNLTYTLGFFTDEARTNPYTTGVTTVGAAGSSNVAYTEITFTESTPQILYYGATNTLASFDYMGNIVITNTGITGASSGGGGGGGGLNNVVEDLTPELGGNLNGLQKGINNISSLSISDGNTGTYGQISFLGFGAGTGPRIRHTNTGDVAINRVYGGGGSYYDTFVFGPHSGPNTSTVPFVCTDSIYSNGFVNPHTTLKQYYVTVAVRTSAHRYYQSGTTAAGYVIQDFANKGFNTSGNPTPLGSAIEAPFLYFVPGTTYRFDQSQSTNAGHQIAFYLEANKTTQYTTGVTTVGTAGQAGAYTEITVTDTTPIVLHYQCVNHSYMGNCVTTNSNVVNYNDLTNKPTLFDGSALDAANLNAGTIPDARFPATLPAISGANLTNLPAANLSNLNANNLTSGTVPDDRFPATLPAASAANLTSIPAANLTGTLPALNGAALTDLNGDNIGSGTIAAARVATLNQDTTGSAATLTTPRAINGVNFDGSADITVTDSTKLPLAGGTLTGTIIVEDAINENVYSITDGSSVDLDPDNGMIQTWTLGADRTATSSLTSGQSMLLKVTTSGSNTYSLTFPNGTKFVGGTTPTISSSEETMLEIFYIGSTLYVANVGDFET